ncbi:unnamed protein product [Amoebophrya sp. A120]|nr:unnamed protein product [Amoebophrya sp. A120]|eukprot:GSA120T00020920001.1
MPSFDSLPAEVAGRIFDGLDLKSIEALRKTSRQGRDVVNVVAADPQTSVTHSHLFLLHLVGGFGKDFFLDFLDCRSLARLQSVSAVVRGPVLDYVLTYPVRPWKNLALPAAVPVEKPGSARFEHYREDRSSAHGRTHAVMAYFGQKQTSGEWRGFCGGCTYLHLDVGGSAVCLNFFARYGLSCFDGPIYESRMHMLAWLWMCRERQGDLAFDEDDPEIAPEGRPRVRTHVGAGHWRTLQALVDDPMVFGHAMRWSRCREMSTFFVVLFYYAALLKIEKPPAGEQDSAATTAPPRSDLHLSAADRLAIQAAWKRSAFGILLLLLCYARYRFRIQGGNHGQGGVTLDKTISADVTTFLSSALDNVQTFVDQSRLWSKELRRAVIDYWLRCEMEITSQGGSGIFEVLRQETQFHRHLPLVAHLLWNESVRYWLRWSRTREAETDYQDREGVSHCFQIPLLVDPTTASLAAKFSRGEDRDRDDSTTGVCEITTRIALSSVEIKNCAALAPDYVAWFKARTAHPENDWAPHSGGQFTDHLLEALECPDYAHAWSAHDISDYARSVHRRRQGEQCSAERLGCFSESPLYKDSAEVRDAFWIMVESHGRDFSEVFTVQNGNHTTFGLLCMLHVLAKLGGDNHRTREMPAKICGYIFSGNHETPGWLRRFADAGHDEDENTEDFLITTTLLSGKGILDHILGPNDRDHEEMLIGPNFPPNTMEIPRSTYKAVARLILADNPWLLSCKPDDWDLTQIGQESISDAESDDEFGLAQR